MSEAHSLFIDGAFISGGDRQTLPVLNPATGKECASLTCATLADSKAAIKAANRAHKVWAASKPEDRASMLNAIANKVIEHQDEIAHAITQEQGKPLPEAREELDGVAAILRHFAEVAQSYPFETTVPGSADRHIRETGKGPVLIINTWNFPVEAIVSHMAPSLAAGCASITLANRDTPACASAFFKAMSELDMPDGLINLLMGQSSQLSNTLLDDPGISHVSYTGSVAVGKALAEQAGRNLKRATLELGGNAPAIVLPGSDIDKVAKAYAGKRFWNAGQVCTAPNRIYVNRDQYEAFIEVVKSYAQSLNVGDGFNDKTDVGPMANERRSAWMQQIVEDALAKGARFVCGQTKPSEGGFFWKPTVLADVPEDALGMTDEIFGPIACIRSYDDIDAVIKSINDCDLGLSGYVFGPDEDEVYAIARKIEAGSIGANQMVTAFIDTPFGGIKQSGLGTVGGASALRDYLFPRLVAMPSGQPKSMTNGAAL